MTDATTAADHTPCSPALLGCPHCGAASPIVHLLESQPSPHVSAVRVICDVTRGGCGASGPMRMLASTAIETWNRRTLPDPPHP